MHKFFAAVALAAGLTFGASANAAVVFFDGFDGENGGASALNYNGFANWTVTNGTVDLISSGGFGITCVGATGECVDLDGTTNMGGTMTSIPIALGVGNFIFSFDISGNQRTQLNFSLVDTVNFQVTNTVVASSVMLPNNAPFQTVSTPFSLLAATIVQIIFDDPNGDNVGLILDNVQIQSVMTTIPEPASLALLGAGLLGLGAASRRRQQP